MKEPENAASKSINYKRTAFIYRLFQSFMWLGVPFGTGIQYEYVLPVSSEGFWGDKLEPA